jgi:hypothetical protein
MVPASTHNVTPLRICTGPDRNAFLGPSATSLTDLPDGQASMAFWISWVSGAFSSAAARLPFTIDLVARSVVHSGGILGSGGSAPGVAPAPREGPPPALPPFSGAFRTQVAPVKRNRATSEVASVVPLFMRFLSVV